jgi:hypothetical protein
MLNKYIKSNIKKNVLCNPLEDSTPCRFSGCNALEIYSYGYLQNFLKRTSYQLLITKLIMINSIIAKMRINININNIYKRLRAISLFYYYLNVLNCDRLQKSHILLKDLFIENVPDLFWVTNGCMSEIAIDRLYLDKFATKMGINLFRFTFLETELSQKNIKTHLQCASVSDVYLFISKTFSKNFDLDILPTPSDSKAIYKLQRLSLDLDYKTCWFSCIRFLKPSFQNMQNKLEFRGNNLKEDYILPYACSEKTNYEVIKSNLLPFFRQDFLNKVEDNYGYSKSIAQDPLVKSEKIIFLFNVGQTMIRFFKKSKLLRIRSLLSSISFNLNVIPKISKPQKLLFSERSFLDLLHKRLKVGNYIQEKVYLFFLKPAHNLLKLLVGFGVVLLIYPYKILIDAENCVFFVSYSFAFFVFVHMILLLLKSCWYFFTGRLQSSKRLDIDIDVIIFISIFITLPLSIFGELIYNPRSPFLILKKWYIKSLI